SDFIYSKLGDCFKIYNNVVVLKNFAGTNAGVNELKGNLLKIAENLRKESSLLPPTAIEIGSYFVPVTDEGGSALPAPAPATKKAV
ncbi:MAG: hypothetical protein LBP36_00435, partial [Oscillospiraceae bacterium]|nr:hypothetical protein [Oscillospiraceae bacterium]